MTNVYLGYVFEWKVLYINFCIHFFCRCTSKQGFAWQVGEVFVVSISSHKRSWQKLWQLSSSRALTVKLQVCCISCSIILRLHFIYILFYSYLVRKTGGNDLTVKYLRFLLWISRICGRLLCYHAIIIFPIPPTPTTTTIHPIPNHPCMCVGQSLNRRII